ncbi:MAG: ATP-binding protein, partial [Sedimenticola sp.]
KRFSLALFPGDCDRPLTDSAVLETMDGIDDDSPCVALGGGCLKQVDGRLASNKIDREPMELCFELFARRELLQPYLDSGAHLVTPGMLAQWRRSYEGWKFEPEEGRAFFGESTSALVLLDTGVDSAAESALIEMADQLGLPWKSLPVGLDHLRLQLYRIVGERQAIKGQESERQLADYAMVHDLIGGISALTTEAQVIDQVLELFSMFCAPTRVSFLPIENGESGQLRLSKPINDEELEPERNRLLGVRSAFELDDEGGGFLINVSRGGQRLGVLSIQDITFKKYRRHYLNLSLTIIPVIALAISNARTFQHQLMAENKVRKLNDELEARLISVNVLNRELEAFTYSVSHDLRGPLRGLDGFSQILLRDYAEHLDERGQQYLGRLCANAQRMGELIDDLLRLSRLSRAEIVSTTVDLSAMVRELADDLQHTNHERDVLFHIEEGVEAQGDASLLKMVLENLVGNAWKYTGKRAGARIEFSCREQDGKRIYSVRDNGDGFDMAYANKLFLPFQRLHSEEEFEGIGIGLATVQRIILRHGGEVWAEAEPGKGAIFHFTL